MLIGEYVYCAASTYADSSNVAKTVVQQTPNAICWINIAAFWNVRGPTDPPPPPSTTHPQK